MANCYKCGRAIKFERKAGKNWPVNLDGSDHFDVCREASFEAVKRDGVFFQTPKGEGYRLDGREVFTMKHGHVITGPNYKISGECKNCVPPWEDCPHGCPDAFQQGLSEADTEGLAHLRAL